MPKRRTSRTSESRGLRWRLAAPGCLLFGSFLATWTGGSPLSAEEPVSIFSAPAAISTESEIHLGQRGLPQMFTMPMLPVPGLRRSNGLANGLDFSSDWSQRRYRTWIRGFGHWCNIDSGGQAAGLEYYSYGVSVGIDQQLGRRLLLGASLGGSDVTARIGKASGQNRQEADLSAAHGSIYCRTTMDQLYFDLEGGLGYNDQSQPSRHSLQWNINAETGTWWGHGFGRIEPFLGLRHVSLDLDPGTETKTTFVGGVRYSWKTTGAFSVTSPRVYGGVLQELGDRELMNAAVFVDAPTVFSIPGYKVAGTRFFFGGGFTSTMGRSLDLYLRYTAEVASDHASHTAMLGMNWNF